MAFPANKTKLVCTVGPASDSPKILEKMISAGMNVARLNFSHGDFSSHKETIRKIREVSHATGKEVAIMADLPGPKMRIGRFAEEPVELEADRSFTLTTEKITGDVQRVSVSFERLPRAEDGHYHCLCAIPTPFNFDYRDDDVSGQAQALAREHLGTPAGLLDSFPHTGNTVPAAASLELLATVIRNNDAELLGHCVDFLVKYARLIQRARDCFCRLCVWFSLVSLIWNLVRTFQHLR